MLVFLNGSKHNLANDDDDLSWLLWFNFLHFGEILRIVQQFCKLAFIMKLNIVNLMEMVEVLVSLFGYIGMEAYYREENIFPSECLPERGGFIFGRKNSGSY